MAFILLSTGQFVQCAEPRADVADVLAGDDDPTVTVKGDPMTFRAEGIVAVAETLEQVDFAPVAVIGD